MKLSNISPRVSQILQILLEQNAPISVKALAEQMNLSKRTIQREMDSINTILKGYEITLNSKTGIGIWLEGSEDKKQELRLQRNDPFAVCVRYYGYLRVLLLRWACASFLQTSPRYCCYCVIL